MIAAPLKVVALRWHDPASGQSTVELETASGQRFTCFSGQSVFVPGEEVSDAQFSLLDAGTGRFEDYFSGNPDKQKRIENTGEWSCRVLGQIVAVRGADAIVDCGGLLLPLANLTHDPTAVGWWVGFSVNRMDVEREPRG